LNDEIKSDLDKECDRLLNGIREQKDTVMKITLSMGVGHAYLVHFVLGIIYANLQTYFHDLYTNKGMAQEHILRADWETYWKDNYTSLTDKLKSLYGL